MKWNWTIVENMYVLDTASPFPSSQHLGISLLSSMCSMTMRSAKIRTEQEGTSSSGSGLRWSDRPANELRLDKVFAPSYWPCLVERLVAPKSWQGAQVDLQCTSGVLTGFTPLRIKLLTSDISVARTFALYIISASLTVLLPYDLSWKPNLDIITCLALWGELWDGLREGCVNVWSESNVIRSPLHASECIHRDWRQGSRLSVFLA